MSAIADDSISYQDFKHVVALNLTRAVPAIVSYIKSHPDRWNEEHLKTLVAFHAMCAAPLIAELFARQTDKVLSAFLRDGLRALSERPDAADAELVAWAKQQSPDAPPCR